MSKMTFTVTLRVFQTSIDDFFYPVEKTVWCFAGGGTWVEFNGKHILTMNGRGTSGTIRFISDAGEIFLVVLGLNDDARWCDIIPDLLGAETGTMINPEYYNGGNLEYRCENEPETCSVTSKSGRKFTITYTAATDNELVANLIIS